jgi:hypothetical protein
MSLPPGGNNGKCAGISKNCSDFAGISHRQGVSRLKPPIVRGLEFSYHQIILPTTRECLKTLNLEKKTIGVSSRLPETTAILLPYFQRALDGAKKINMGPRFPEGEQ